MEEQPADQAEHTGMTMLVDSGASVNVIGQKLADQHHLKVHSQERRLFGAGGYEYAVTGASKVGPVESG